MVKPRTESAPHSNTARFALALLCVSTLVILALQFVDKADTVPDTPHGIYAREIVWTCERDGAHSFKNRFRYEPLPCRICDGKCFIQLGYTCPTHNHAFSALVEFSRPTSTTGSSHADGVPTVARYRYTEEATWRTSDGAIPCPTFGCKTASHRREVSWTTRTNATRSGD